MGDKVDLKDLMHQASRGLSDDPSGSWKGPVKIAFAESCTGGRLAADLTAIPGSSRVICGSIVAYQIKAKQDLLGLTEVTEENVVSAETAKGMARAALDKFGADIAISTTGYLDGEHPRAFVGVAMRGAPGLLVAAEPVTEGLQPVLTEQASTDAGMKIRAANREVVVQAAFESLECLVFPTG